MTSSFYIQNLLVAAFIISRLCDLFVKASYNKAKVIYIVILNVISFIYIIVYAQVFLTHSLNNVYWFNYLIYVVILILYVIYIIKVFKK